MDKATAHHKADLREHAALFCTAGGSHEMAMMWAEYARKLREIARKTPATLPMHCRPWPGE